MKARSSRALRGIAEGYAKGIVVAYEPVGHWNRQDGYGGEANRVIKVIRETLAGSMVMLPLQPMRIQYGGSVKPGNMAELMGQPEIDGALVGELVLTQCHLPGLYAMTIEARKSVQRRRMRSGKAKHPVCHR